jgi:hypothetical protein
VKFANHPNIIETTATFAHAERTCIVMAYAEGGSLAGKLKREHPMPMNAVAPRHPVSGHSSR